MAVPADFPNRKLHAFITEVPNLSLSDYGDRDPGSLDYILAAHPRIHTAEGCFHRDVLMKACTIPVELVSPKSLDPASLGKIASPPWGRTQKLAALAAWRVLAASRS